jgi:hypothetical protein
VECSYLRCIKYWEGAILARNPRPAALLTYFGFSTEPTSFSCAAEFMRPVLSPVTDPHNALI